MRISSSASNHHFDFPVSIGQSSWCSVDEIAGRLLLAALFLISGLGKIGVYAGTVTYMSSAGVPGAQLPAVIADEVLGALAIVLGRKTRIAAFILAGYSLLTAVIFHHNFADRIRAIQFVKHFSIAGGFSIGCQPRWPVELGPPTVEA
jgi:putative oxidoreductase